MENTILKKRVAHGMLGAYLVQHGLLDFNDGCAQLTGYQGRSMHRPGEVQVKILVDGTRASHVQITGSARIVYSTDISLD